MPRKPSKAALPRKRPGLRRAKPRTSSVISSTLVSRRYPENRSTWSEAWSAYRAIGPVPAFAAAGGLPAHRTASSLGGCVFWSSAGTCPARSPVQSRSPAAGWGELLPLLLGRSVGLWPPLPVAGRAAWVDLHLSLRSPTTFLHEFQNGSCCPLRHTLAQSIPGSFPNRSVQSRLATTSGPLKPR